MIKVLTVPHTMFAAKHLVDQLNRLGQSAQIVDHVERSDRSMYFIYNAAAVGHLPKNYVVMQTEIAKSHWFNERYKCTLRNARAVWDYSDSNIRAYESQNKRICIVKPGVNIQERKEKDIDILFYGWFEGSPRRQKIIEEIKNHVELYIVTNILTAEMWGLLDRAKVVINVHYFEDSPLELYRINECLSHSCHVVSEGFHESYLKVVNFRKSPEQIALTAIEKTGESFAFDLSSLDNLNEIKHGLDLAGI